MGQLLQRHPEAHILACAPSNKAADIIAQKLMHLGPTDVFRLNSLSRKYGDLPKTLSKFSLVNGNLTFTMPVLEDVLKHRVVVCTCVSAGALAGLGVKPGHFGWIFIDEAGQATEPDTMIPIKGLTDNQTNVILAGDSKQLGPIVHSRLALDLGLKESYLVRLMERPCYNLSPWNDNGSGGGRGVTYGLSFASCPYFSWFAVLQDHGTPQEFPISSSHFGLLECTLLRKPTTSMWRSCTDKEHGRLGGASDEEVPNHISCRGWSRSKRGVFTVVLQHQ